MRNLSKGEAPALLRDRQASWTSEFLADPDNSTKRYRYRHHEIKATLLAETFSKCIYCESKVGHNTPGDVEHKVPTSEDQTLHFSWDNLTVACTECNRRKNDYFDAGTPFLDPYSDDVEGMLLHNGPIVNWVPGNVRAEVAVNILELNRANRWHLICRKIEHIQVLNNLLARIKNESSAVMVELLKKQLEEMQHVSAEYSGMVLAVCEQLSARAE